ncbi:MAG TPA: DUF2163 domain-containing protein [Hyphomicrobiales bacterium]|nr:DUF2163 domain-containing protein [Hyphomicrobiales bacterium]
MRTIPPDLAAHLAGSVTTLCRCWRATRSDGRTFGFTDHDRDLVFDGTTFAAASGLDAAEATASLGFAVGGGEVAGAFSDDALAEADLAAGLWDAASVEVFVVNWAAPDQRLRVAVGEIGEVRRDDRAFTAELRGPSARLNVVTGRLFSPTCDAALGDAHCTVALAVPAFTGSGTVTAAEDGFTITASGLDAYADGWFRGGVLAWTSGANAGLAQPVRQHSAAGGVVRIALWQAAPRGVATGDAFSIGAGCDKTAATCQAKFANIANFRGFAQMPGTDRVLTYPTGDDGQDDGGSFFL